VAKWLPVSHYRDERNPEGVHFPARLYVIALQVAVAVLIAATMVLTFLYGTPQDGPRDLLVLVGCFVAMALLWPRRITTDQHGIRRPGPLGLGMRFIAWKDVRLVKESSEIPLLPRRLFGCLTNSVIVVRGPKGTAPIGFTSRHSSRETFLHELKRWGAPGL